MRCAAFADALQARGVSAVFVTRAGEDSAVDLLRATGRAVEELPPDVGLDDDARFTWKVAERHGARLIVTDVCHWDALRDPDALRTYHAVLHEDYAVVALTGGRLVDLPATLVVAPYVHAAEAASDARHLFGPRYFIFRRSFVEAAGRPRIIEADAHRVLVTMGGSDPAELTPNVLCALQSLTDRRLTVRVVIGPRFGPRTAARVRELAGTLPGRCTVLRHDADLAVEMLLADLAITADGFTRYETAVTGTPSVTLELPGSDGGLNERFAAAGTTLSVPNAPSVTVEQLGRLVRDVLGNHDHRRRMSESGKRLVDGHGVERVLAALPAGVLA